MPRLPLALALGLIALALSGRPDWLTAQTMGSPAQTGLFTTRNLGVGDGLPQSSVTQLQLDDDGFLWGATYGGLFRFDGRRFLTVVPNRDDDANGLAITGMISSAKGGFWITNTRGAVSRLLEGIVVEALPIADDIPPVDFPTSLHETRDGRVWLLGWGRARTWDGARWSTLPTDVQRAWPGTPLFEDASGNLLVSTTQGYMNLAGGRPLPYPFQQIRTTSFTSTTYTDTLGRPWIGARDHFYLYDPPRLIPIPEARGILLGVFPRYDGSVWIVTFAGVWLAKGPGLDRPGQVETETLTLAKVDLPPSLEILSAALTRDDVLMLGLLGQGLLAVTPAVALPVNLPSYLLNSQPDTMARPVHSVVADSSGGLWVSRECREVTRLVGPKLTSFRTSGASLERTHTVDEGCTRSLHITRDGALLVGIPRGMLRVRLDSSEIERIAIPGPAPEGPATPIAQPAPVSFLELGGDSLLVGMTDGRLVLIRPGEPTIPWPGWMPVGGGITALAQNDSGTRWIGAESQLWAIYPDGAIRLDSDPESLSRSGQIRILHPEPDGGLWIGRYGGGLTYRHANGRRTDVPLQDPTLSTLVPAGDGAFWIAQNSGISILPSGLLDAVRQGLPFTPAVQRLQVRDGIPEVNNGRPAAALLPSGLLAVGTVGGLLLLDPSALPSSVATPPIRVGSIRTSSGTLEATGGFLALPMGDRDLEVDLAIPAYRTSSPVQLRYRIAQTGMRNRPGEWVNLSYGEALRLGGLAPGRRRLEIEATVPGGSWVAATPVDFLVRPLFAERRSVQLGIFILVLILVLLLIRGRIREQERERRLALERRLEAERERHLGELALMGRHAVAGELTASLAHEMGQPLAAMLQTATAVKAEMAAAPLPPEVLEETMEELVGQIHRARTVLQGMRRFLRSDSPQFESLDLMEVLNEIRDLVQRQLRRAKVTLLIEGPSEPIEVAGERVLIQQTLIILIANAMDAVDGLPADRRTLRLRVKPVGEGGRATLQDVGSGIARERLKTLFEPFQTTKHTGMGMGLLIARRIVRSHRGGLQIRSREGAGTVVSFWIPKNDRSGEQPPI